MGIFPDNLSAKPEVSAKTVSLIPPKRFLLKRCLLNRSLPLDKSAHHADVFSTYVVFLSIVVSIVHIFFNSIEFV